MSALPTEFHPLIRAWFSETVGAPTRAQTDAWAHIRAGEHVLVTAPTGSGKTLAAFLWALDRLMTGALPAGRLGVLYVSPLKALNNDIRRNLLAPLEALSARFAAEGVPAPPLRVMTRSGDTEPAERRAMLRHPPEILITTPESLNLLLSTPSAQGLFAHLSTVILDEIHAIAPTKRGVHLITAVDRLVRSAGEFQRIALSATLKPPEVVAEFVGGFALDGRDGQAVYRRRKVVCVNPPASKRLELAVQCPAETDISPGDDSAWPALTAGIRRLVERGRSTLVFTNSRRLCERVCLLLNESAGRVMAYSHHGSLSRETRTVVEQRLKRGELDAIVATNSLELGIDIGALDAVALVQTPPTVAATVQRVGRAGHQVGAVSRGVLFPTHDRDYLDAAVMARAVEERDIEPMRVPLCPLDVLAQVVVSMVSMEPWDLDRLYAFLRTSAPYHGLTRTQFDLVVAALAGRYEETRLRALQPVVFVDREENTVRGTRAALRLLYLAGGTIPDRGYFTMRRGDTRAKVGELDEEFVWERKKGDTFTLGTQTWRLEDVTHNDVLVSAARPGPSTVPFWKGEELDRSFHFSERVARFLEDANDLIDSPEFPGLLEREYCMEPGAAERLVGYLRRQRRLTRADLPHRHHLLVEYAARSGDPSETGQAILHTLWGGALNRPYALALAQAWEERFGGRVEAHAGNDSIALLLPTERDVAQLIELVRPEDLEGLLRRRLEQTGFFGARFRENAAIALMLPRGRFGERMPLWLNRLRSKRLLDAVMRYPDFPILAETWRTCLRDEFDLDNLKRMLRELESGEIRVSQVMLEHPSPFAESSGWRLTNLYMYMDDTPSPGRVSRLSDELFAEVVHATELRPRIPAALIRRFESKAQRTHPGYAPTTPDDLLLWVEDRLLLPESEWDALLDACRRDRGGDPGPLLAAVARKLLRIRFGGGPWFVIAHAAAARVVAAFGADGACVETAPLPLGEGGAPALPASRRRARRGSDAEPLEQVVSEWLRYYGPVRRDVLDAIFPVAPERLTAVLDSLQEARTVVIGPLSEGGDAVEVCDAENLERLLRLLRAESRPAFEPLPIEALPLFAAHYQGAARSHRRADAPIDPADRRRRALQEAIDALFLYPLPAPMLEGDVLPARVDDYSPATLDQLLHESDLMWIGTGIRQIALAMPEHLELLPAPRASRVSEGLSLAPRGRYSFSDLAAGSRLDSAELARRIWEQVWRGAIANDTFAALRKGIETRFRPARVAEFPSRGRGSAFNRWRATRPFAGSWYLLDRPGPAADSLEQDERNRDRVRVLLDRYGVLFRERLAGEQEPFRWGALFCTLRLMELSGEVVSGQFFEGIPGLQFASAAALRALRRPLPEDEVFWLNAADPASVCGLDLDAIKGELPRRVPTTHLVWHGRRLALVSQRLGRALEVRVPCDHPRLPEYYGVLTHLLTRAFDPLPHITVETVNGVPVRQSPYLESLRACFDAAPGPRNMVLRPPR